MPRISIDDAIKRGIKSGELHTILIPRTIPLEDAKLWLKQHGYKIRHRSTKNFYRMNQLPEILGSKYATKILPNTGGIEFVFQYFDDKPLKGGFGRYEAPVYYGSGLIEKAKAQAKKLKIPFQDIQLSNKKDKKLLVITKDGKKINFGLKNSHTFLEGAPKQKRDAYRARASKITNKDGEYTYLNYNSPNYWAFHILW